MPEREKTSGPILPTPRSSVTGSGVLRVRPKGTDRHVAELDALAGGDLDDIIVTSRAAVATRLDLARSEVMLNVWTVSADVPP